METALEDFSSTVNVRHKESSAAMSIGTNLFIDSIISYMQLNS